MLSIAEYNSGAREFTIDEARRLTERIRIMAHSVAEQVEKLQGLVAQAKAGAVHEQLGYASWTAYLADVLGEAPMRLERDARQEMSRMLTGEGMSTRAAAKVLGVGHKTVARDVEGVSNDTPEPEPDDAAAKVLGVNQATVVRDSRGDANASPEPEPVDDSDEIEADPVTGEVIEGPTIATREGVVIAEQRHVTPEPRTVTGLDGKTYKTPEQKPRRRPLPDQAGTAGWDLAKAIDRVERVVNDDRFDTHKAEVATQLRSHLTNAIESCQGLLDRINH